LAWEKVEALRQVLRGGGVGTAALEDSFEIERCVRMATSRPR
jgi:hypothetical protein